jgi:hypothetical protein
MTCRIQVMGPLNLSGLTDDTATILFMSCSASAKAARTLAATHTLLPCQSL